MSNDAPTVERAADALENAEEKVRPTYAPAAMAMGVMLLLWGVVTHWFMSLVGAAMIGWALFTWINEIRICATVGQASSLPSENDGDGDADDIGERSTTSE
ncbi:MAG: hypothetical protein RIC55_03165 [Pirellulaceae bacterium]